MKEGDFNWFLERGTYISVVPEIYPNGMNFLVWVDTIRDGKYVKELSTACFGDNGEFKTWNEAMEFGLNIARKLYGMD